MNHQVTEGAAQVLSVDVVTVRDLDTPMSQLTFVVETPPSFGRIESRKPGLNCFYWLLFLSVV